MFIATYDNNFAYGTTMQIAYNTLKDENYIDNPEYIRLFEAREIKFKLTIEEVQS